MDDKDLISELERIFAGTNLAPEDIKRALSERDERSENLIKELRQTNDLNRVVEIFNGEPKWNEVKKKALFMFVGAIEKDLEKTNDPRTILHLWSLLPPDSPTKQFAAMKYYECIEKIIESTENIDSLVEISKLPSNSKHLQARYFEKMGLLILREIKNTQSIERAKYLVNVAAFDEMLVRECLRKVIELLSKEDMPKKER